MRNTKLNTMISQAISDMLPQMKEDMSPFKETVRLLEKYRLEFQVFPPNEAASVDRIIEETKKSLKNPKVLEQIYNLWPLAFYSRISS